MNTKPASILHTFPPADEAAAAQLLNAELPGFSRKIVVLDDDPTGIQTVHDVSVYTNWEKSTLMQAFMDSTQMFFILTNSRSLSKAATTALHKEIAENLAQVSTELGIDFLLLSRGDSTLRGHYPLETMVLRNTLEAQMGHTFDGEIFCPFFPEGGRYTFDNIHYVKEKAAEEEILVPAGDTEFAKDKTFPFDSSDLTEYMEEKSEGARRREDCICISLEELRSLDCEGITQKLLSAENFAPVIVNAVSYTDLKVFAAAWIRAMKAGRRYLARCAAALPKIIGNISDKPLLTVNELKPQGTANGGLIIIGSHVKKTTAQFEALIQAGLPLSLLEFHVQAYFEEGGLEQETQRLLADADKLIRSQKTVLIYTSRKLLAPEGFSEEELLALSVKISESLTSIVSLLPVKPSFILAKGGITSSDVGTIGLHVKKALVMGQVKPGIPVWKTGPESKFPDMPYIIFPGNVGTETTLKEIVEMLV